MQRDINLTITEKENGKRLDQALATLLSDWSRSRLQQWIKSGQLQLNATAASPKQKVFTGDHITGTLVEQVENDDQPQAIPLEVVFEDNLSEYMNFELKPNFKVLGRILGKKMGAFGKALSALDASSSVATLQSGGSVAVDLGDEVFEATSEHVDVRISAKEGFTVEMANNRFVILDTTLDEALIAEGYAREFVSRIQQMRKANDFDVADKIEVAFNSTSAFEAAVASFEDYIKAEVLANTLVTTTEGEFETFTLNEQKTSIRVVKA